MSKAEYNASNRHNARPTIALLGNELKFLNPTMVLKSAIAAIDVADANLLYFSSNPVRSPLYFETQANILYEMADATNVDGILIAANLTGLYTSVAKLEAFFSRYQHLPMVSMGVALETVPSVILDNFTSMSALVKHLLEEHHYRRIAFLGGSQDHPEVQERYRAFTTTLKDYDVPLDPDLVIFSDFLYTSARQVVQHWLDERQLRPHHDIEAIVAANDYMAMGAMSELQARGIQVPDDIAVVGFDDIAVSQSFTPPLTTVRQPFYKVGQQATELLLARMTGQSVPELTSVAAEVIIRHSCGCTTLDTHQTVDDMPPDKLDKTFRESPRHFFQQLNQTFFTGSGAHNENEMWVWNEMGVWNEALTLLRDEQSQSPSDARQLTADTPEVQIRTVLREAILQSLQNRAGAQVLQNLGQRLLSTLNVAELMDILAEDLPRLGIRSAYLSLYEDPPAYEFPQPVPQWSRLILAYNAQGRSVLPPEGLRFPTQELLPQGFGLFEEARGMIVEALYFQREQIGFALLEIGAKDDAVYEILRRYLSNALQGALLLQQVQERSAELTRQQYILDTFMENVPDHVYFKDLESRITRANKAHAGKLGFSDPAEEVGKNDFDFFPEEQARIKYEQEQEIIRTGQPILNLEEVDGIGHWALTTKMPLRDENGEIIGTFGISHDITEMRRVQAELVRQERLSALGQLTATVAHEIRNPLGTVRTAVFSIGDAIERDEMNRVKRALQLAERNIVRCDAIITELLDYTRSWLLQCSSTDIDKWLNGLLDEVLDQGNIPKDIVCVREFNANVEVSADTEHLRRAVINVVNNAVDAMQEKELDKGENRLTVSTHIVGERLEIRVHDTGCGIPDEVMNRLFEPLFSTKSFGVGLGLPIVRGIMEQHGGGIEIRSQINIGTTVILWLPMIGRAED